jgi:hypothetical protein
MLLFLTAPLSGLLEPVVKEGGVQILLQIETIVTNRKKHDVYLPKYWVGLKSNLSLELKSTQNLGR